MSVNITECYIIEVCSSATKDYRFEFPIDSETQLEVYLENSNEVYTKLEYAKDYIVKKYRNTFNQGGYVSVMTLYDSTHKLIIFRDTIINQLLSLYGNALPLEVIKSSLDKLTMILQEQQVRIKNSVKTAPNEPEFSLTLPPVAERKNKVIGFDENGNIQMFDNGGGGGTDAKFLDTLKVVLAQSSPNRNIIVDGARQVTSRNDFAIINDVESTTRTQHRNDLRNILENVSVEELREIVNNIL